ncbi:thioredoxin-like protein CXXS1 [Amaranthus tricolor]|uniref:thioredoxin-like protein CXXS1 n=1 Tax=Amaranthus tricolor TaxID=29722 RepID=UPI002586C9FB|nr:thioredoxin-like protein CXXS1 [Amaranthus tricolor]
MAKKNKEMVKSRVSWVNSEKSWESFLLRVKTLNLPVVVHFTATWCMPSVAMNPFFDDLALNNPCALFLRVDMDEVLNGAKQLRVTAMPTFLMMNNGVIVDKLVGANPQEMQKTVGNFVQLNYAKEGR